MPVKIIPSITRTRLGVGIAAAALLPPIVGLELGLDVYKGWDDAPVPATAVLLGTSTSAVSTYQVTVVVAGPTSIVRDMVTGQDYKMVQYPGARIHQG